MSTPHHVHIDFETRSAADLRKTGAYAYALHPTTGLWLACYAFDDEPVQTWYPHEPCPERLADHVEHGGLLLAWNGGSFERIIWKCILARRYGWPEPKLTQWDDPMVWAATMSFPATLAQAAQALGLSFQKDDPGRRLMLQMAKPRKIHADGGITWWDQPDKIERLAAYCATDVEVEREATKALLPLSPAERQMWLLDQRINDRGIKLDLPFIAAAKRVVARRVDKLNRQLATVTAGRVRAATNVAAIGTWLVERGYPTASLDKAAVAAMLARDDLPDDVRQVLHIRREAGKSSTAKLDAMEAVVCPDARARGTFRFNRATTGRWGAQLIQLHNLPRGQKLHQKQFDDLISAISTGDDDWVQVEFGDPMDAVSSSLRGCLIPARGKRFVSRDFSAIESRKLAWSAGEQWKVKAFLDFDGGDGADQYRLAYARTFNVPIDDVDFGNDRQAGKVIDLSMGYGGGVGALVAMAGTYGLSIQDLVAAARPSIPADTWRLAEEAYKTLGGGDELAKEEWITLDSIKRLWRDAHPATVRYWYALQDAACNAVQNPGTVHRISSCDIRYRVANGHLWCRLPSGRLICYPFPRVKEAPVPWGGTKPQLSFMGVNALTKQWTRQPSFGGHLAENNTQAIGACYQRNAIARCETAGIPIVLHVHDEVVAEVLEADAEAVFIQMGNIMRTPPPWAAGCPIASSGFIADRYRKE